MSEFVEIAKKSDVAEGAGKLVEVDGKKIALFNVGGEISAIDNTCTHQGGPLCDGQLDGSIVTCPWHGWQYDVKTGVSPVNPAAKVNKYNIKVEGDSVLLEKT